MTLTIFYLVLLTLLPEVLPLLEAFRDDRFYNEVQLSPPAAILFSRVGIHVLFNALFILGDNLKSQSSYRDSKGPGELQEPCFSPKSS